MENETVKHPPVVAHDRETSIVTYVTAEDGTDRNGIVFGIPLTEKEAQEERNCSLNYLVGLGLRGLSTRIDFKGTHKEMQAQADAYRVRVPVPKERKVRKTIKGLEAQRDVLMDMVITSSGLSIEEIQELVEKQQTEQAEIRQAINPSE